MLSRAELKTKAKDQLRGNWSNAALATLILSIISIIIQSFMIPNIELNTINMNTITILVFSLCITTLINIYSLLTQSFLYLTLTKEKKIKFSNLLVSPRIYFKFILFNLLKMLLFIPLFLMVIGLTVYGNIILMYILTILVLLLFIIVELYTSQIPFILVDNPKINIIEVIKKSFFLMKGNLITLLILNLSFIGWSIANVFTWFVGSIFLYPYIFTTKANFYIELKKLKYNKSEEESSINL
ncbi:DUF975 family protein [Clostridium tarantellae]|uniref:DUF975 family protein n=1 Tax=Clostridium tarantellae TaxID=39493 RepID=UPI001F269C96|nr:DUF975 family protein [Clostridium tarantellae]